MGERTTSSVIWLLLAAVFVAMGCRDVAHQPGRQHDHSLFPRARADREWYPGSTGSSGGTRPDFGPMDPKAVVNRVLEGPLEPYDIQIAPEDTLNLYAKWTARSARQLLELNPAAKGHGLVAGEGFHLVLTKGEFARFNGSRTAYLAKVRARREQGVYVVDLVMHQVRADETLADILKNYRTNMDQLEKMNPRVRLTGIRTGQVLKVPIVSQQTGDQPSLPGPRPPTPHPVPQPPEDTKPLTVEPETSPQDPVLRVGKYYVVRSGDTAWEIARDKLKVSLEALVTANPQIDMDRIRPGMRLLIPGKPDVATRQ